MEDLAESPREEGSEESGKGKPYGHEPLFQLVHQSETLLPSHQQDRHVPRGRPRSQRLHDPAFVEELSGWLSTFGRSCEEAYETEEVESEEIGDRESETEQEDRVEHQVKWIKKLITLAGRCHAPTEAAHVENETKTYCA